MTRRALSYLCFCLAIICAKPSFAADFIDVTNDDGVAIAINQAASMANSYLPSTKAFMDEHGQDHTILEDGRLAFDKLDENRFAYYARPTKRYGHGILGDKTEAAELILFDLGERLSVRHRSWVFEDLYPRFYDIDKDGKSEIIAIEASPNEGASLGIYTVGNGKLLEQARVPFIGAPNRWMNPAGFADFDGDGLVEIALVDRPHIRGELEFWTYDPKASPKLTLRTSIMGYSNHKIGSRNLQLSAVIELNGKPLLAISDTSLRIMHLIDASFETPKSIAKFELPAPILGDIVSTEFDGQPLLSIPLTNGKSIALKIAP